MDRGAWWATVHGVSRSPTQLSDLAHSMYGLHLGLNILFLLDKHDLKHSFIYPCNQLTDKMVMSTSDLPSTSQGTQDTVMGKNKHSS